MLHLFPFTQRTCPSSLRLACARFGASSPSRAVLQARKTGLQKYTFSITRQHYQPTFLKKFSSGCISVCYIFIWADFYAKNARFRGLSRQIRTLSRSTFRSFSEMKAAKHSTSGCGEQRQGSGVRGQVTGVRLQWSGVRPRTAPLHTYHLLPVTFYGTADSLLHFNDKFDTIIIYV